MARWTPNGWETCLGAALKFSSWDDRTGPAFELETKARVVVSTDFDYYCQVTRLELVGKLKGEDTKRIRYNVLAAPGCPWSSLALLQRKHLAKGYTEYRQKYPVNQRATLYNEMKARSLEDMVENISVRGDQIIIPAAATKSPPRDKKKLQVMKSFLGGRQVFVAGDSTLEYELSKDVLPTQSEQYKVSVRLNTVHRNEQPMILTVSSDKKTDAVSVLQIPVPYTMGEWKQTEEVVVDIPGGCQKVNLSLARQCKQFGTSIKDMTLTRV